MKVEVGGFAVESFFDELPAIWPEFERRAALVEHFDAKKEQATLLGVALWSRAEKDWPRVVITQRFSPGLTSGFIPGVVVIPETHIVFMGAGTLLLAFDMREPRRLWEDFTQVGFWGWRRHGEAVLMSAELELAAYDTVGQRRWSVEVEPPWSYSVENNEVVLDIMGTIQRFSLVAGPTL